MKAVAASSAHSAAPADKPAAAAAEKPADKPAAAPAEPLSAEAAALARIKKLAGKVKYDGGRVVDIDLDPRPVTDADLELIARAFPHLARLKLYGTDITDAGVKHLTKITALASLSLRNTEIHDESLKALRPLSGLKSLNLHHCSFLSNKALGYIKDFPNLETLTLLYDNFQDDSLIQLRGMKKLRAAGHPLLPADRRQGPGTSQGHDEPPHVESPQWQ